MDQSRVHVLDTWPFPVAYPYAMIFDEREVPSNRRWALCFTVYQLLRLVCLPLVSQYLREEIDTTARDSVRALNGAIAAIRSPFFSDWIDPAYVLRRHLTKVGIVPLFPRLGDALEGLHDAAERPFGLRGNTVLKPLEAILALRNGTAHGGLPDQAEAAEHVQLYLSVLHQILDAFDFLGDTVLRVCPEAPQGVVTGRAHVRVLRGVQVGAAVPEELTDDLVTALTESQAVLTGPDGRTVPLYPLFHPVTAQEPLFLYDGHYGIQVQTRQGLEERSYIYYLGTHHRATDSPACERLKTLLQRRQISFFLSKEQTAPWTIADSASDYSRRTLEELRGTKYFPECYLPFPDLEQHFERFLRMPPPERWPADTSRRRYVNGLVLTGLAGAGKTAFLARQVETLLQQPGEAMDRENPNLVLFLRGNGIALRPEGMSLFRDVAEKLGIAVEGATTRSRSQGGFSSFRELLEHLHSRWKQDRLPGRRLILVLDALNEAPFAEQVITEALDMIGEAACYPWCKVIVSTRQEWLGLWSGKLGAQEKSPLEALRPFLYVTEAEQRPGPGAPGSMADAGPPVVALEPLSEVHAQAVYERYQAAARGTPAAEQAYRIPACQTPWSAGRLPRGSCSPTPSICICSW